MPLHGSIDDIKDSRSSFSIRYRLQFLSNDHQCLHRNADNLMLSQFYRSCHKYVPIASNSYREIPLGVTGTLF